jgi:hypothetical protein
MAGRPRKEFDQAIADYICDRIASTPLGIEDVIAGLKDPDIVHEYKSRGELHSDLVLENAPSHNVIIRWRIENKAFREQLKCAREEQAEVLGDLMVKTACEPLIGVETKTGGKQGDITTTGDNVERSRLICWTLLKRMGQLNPKRYGTNLVPDGGTDRLAELVTALRGS